MKVNEGLSEVNIDQLIVFTNSDEDVKRFTSDLKRFKNKESIKEWLKKGRKIYTLVDDDENLKGISWFGPEGEGFTFGVRIYGDARGKGLSKKFLGETMAKYMTEPEFVNAKCKDLWLETSKDNLPAIKIYVDLGFVKIGDGATSNKSIYIKKY